MAEIIPAVMPKSLEDLREKAARVAPFVSLIQIDVMDGVFVPERTWPYLESQAEAVLGGASLSLPESLGFEVDLMVAEPQETIPLWIERGARSVIIHFESTERIAETIAKVREAGGIEVGLSWNLDTPLAEVLPHIEFVDVLQCMGIARIGYQGEPFDERALVLVRSLRERYPSVTISVDGGVHRETAPALIAAGANRLVAGSEIFSAEHPGEVIASLSQQP